MISSDDLIMDISDRVFLKLRDIYIFKKLAELKLSLNQALKSILF